MCLKANQIELDNPWNTYYAGQTVNGKVTFTFDSPAKIHGIAIEFSGEAETKWNEIGTKVDQYGKQDESLIILNGQESYLQIQYYLLGGKNSNEIDLDAGIHSYPFTCALPSNLPSSFEGEWGFVRYMIKVTLDRPFLFDRDIEMAFTVITPVDLNSNPRVKDPFKLELETKFCCFCCASGPLSVTVHVPMTGFVSGQPIPLTIECDNASNVGVESVKLFLRKLLIFHVRTPRRDTKKTKEVISEISVGPFKAGKCRTWNHSITVPILTLPNLINCSIIDIEYDIKVEATPHGLHLPIEGNIPIVLGTVPLSSLQPMLPTQPISPASPSNFMPLPWKTPDIAPPTFEEATFQAPTISNRNDSQFTRFVGPVEYAMCYTTDSVTPSAPPEEL